MKNIAGLLPRQVPAVEQLLAALSTYGSALDGSDMGTGKTYVAGGVLRELDVPALVVCPQIAISQWRNMGQQLGVEFDALNYEKLRTGKTPFGSWANERAKTSSWLRCNSCQLIFDPADPQPCPHHWKGFHCLETKTRPHNYGRFNWHPGIKALVFDEAHRCSATDSLQADMLIAARRQNIPTVSLSGTVADSPLSLRALGYSLGLHKLTDFYPWALRHGCIKMPSGGFHFYPGEERRRKIMGELHAQIFPAHGVRTRIADLGTDFPDCRIDAELYDLASSGRVADLYADMSAAIDRLNIAKSGDADHPLTEILRARMEIELLKVPIFVEITQDAIAEGRHVAIFCCYRDTINELCRRLKTNCRIDGSQTGVAGARERQANVDMFQEDKSPVIVCSDAGAACIGLHDVLGNFPRLGLISPGYSAREFRQKCGRLRRQGAKSKAFYRAIFVAGTVEEKVHKALAAKLNNLDALLDADLWAVNLPLIHRAEI